MCHVLPLCSENILVANGDAGIACPVTTAPGEDWDANGDLGAGWCCPCLGLSPFIFETWRGGWLPPPLPGPSFLVALGKGGGGGGIDDPWYPTGGWPGILPCWAPIPPGLSSFPRPFKSFYSTIQHDKTKNSTSWFYFCVLIIGDISHACDFFLFMLIQH